MKSRCFLTSLLLCASASVAAEELVVEADVLRSEAVVETTGDSGCTTGAPDVTNLTDMLAYDLCLGRYGYSNVAETVTGYKVFYQWDGRVFSQMMRDAPGKKIPLRLTIN